ncbi:MAG TPA: 5-demethoxyubiquinol-8 5-hydroxylase UbiM, partial [Rhodopila sp.]|nr:5-demethoxyubiquinol-8 5-hydroxylase UbiM [Rhodopila sp.]
MQFDIVIVGAGPAGMALARSLTGSGLSVALIEKRPEADLANPAFDGREIALTHRSLDILRRLDAWRHIPPDVPSDMREARVLNGVSPYALRFETAGQRYPTLGSLVPNHLIRKALYEIIRQQPDVTLLCGRGVTQVGTANTGATVTLEDKETIGARLVVAADTRFSETRRRQGIPAIMHDFGKTMIVCAVAHEQPHHHIATEWFEHGHTIAMLPMRGNRSSAVLTDEGPAADRLMAMDPDEFGKEVTRRFRGRLGEMRLDSSRHAYPLIATYAARFAARRFVLVGDSAVGMHPVTAQGFNFGLQGQDTLAKVIRRTAGRGGDIGAPTVLREYEMKHRAATLPLWLATNVIARLYVEESLPARVAREVTLRLGVTLPLVRG